MQRIQIFNPVAGKGHSPELLTNHEKVRDEIYITKGVDDARRFFEETARTEPETHFVVYGGDGTVNEAVNGILRAGAGDSALLSIVPIGTGNDTLRSLPETKGEILRVDAIRYNGKYAINIVNMGFDCSVVDRTQIYKKLPVVTGSFAYILGVADVFIHKLGEPWSITLTGADGTEENLHGEFLLSLIANGRCYGGGFRPAPLADMQDGLLDIVMVPKIKRSGFVKLINDYRKGTHLDPATGHPVKKFENILLYRQCRKITVDGIHRLCADGEIETAPRCEAEAVPSALNIQIL